MGLRVEYIDDKPPYHSPVLTTVMLAGPGHV